MEEQAGEIIQGEFPEVVKISQQQRLEEYNIYQGRLNEKLAMIGYKDSELIQLLDAVVAGTIWLKEHNDKEGSLYIAYKKKKNVHGAAEAKILVTAKYRHNLNETDVEVLSRNFLSKEILLDDGHIQDIDEGLN